MIIGGHQKLPVGFRGRGVTDDHGRLHPDQPFVVVREATAAEYLAAERARDAAPIGEKQLAFIHSGKAFFYEISVD